MSNLHAHFFKLINNGKPQIKEILELSQSIKEQGKILNTLTNTNIWLRSYPLGLWQIYISSLNWNPFDPEQMGCQWINHYASSIIQEGVDLNCQSPVCEHFKDYVIMKCIFFVLKGFPYLNSKHFSHILQNLMFLQTWLANFRNNKQSTFKVSSQELLHIKFSM